MSQEALGPAGGPDAAPSEAGAPDTAQPAAGAPDTAQPAAGAPDTAQPGADAPDTAQPGAGPDSYEEAAARIEEIIRRLDSGQGGLRETLELCREGRSLVEFCAGELEAVGRGLEELRLEELVSRLEGGAKA